MAMKYATSGPKRPGLVLQLKLGESVRVGNDIEFTVTAHGPGRVRVRVVAPSIDDVSDEALDRAFAYFVMSWMGRNGSSGTVGYNITVARRYTSNGGSGGYRYRSAAESLGAWHERLRSVLITNVDGMMCLDRIEDKAGSAIYLDPPYLKKGSKYLHDFDGIHHHRLAESLKRFRKTRVVLSYYDDPWLRSRYPERDWEWIDCAMTKSLVNQGMRDGSGTTKAPEVLICNRRASDGR